MIRENVEIFEGSVKDFLSKITYKRCGYLKKYRAQKVTKLWWEKSEDWFLNVSEGKQNNYDESVWVTRGDSEKYIKFISKDKGYVMYLEKENKKDGE